jgi:hypothetical protein
MTLHQFLNKYKYINISRLEFRTHCNQNVIQRCKNKNASIRNQDWMLILFELENLKVDLDLVIKEEGKKLNVTERQRNII